MPEAPFNLTINDIKATKQTIDIEFLSFYDAMQYILGVLPPANTTDLNHKVYDMLVTGNRHIMVALKQSADKAKGWRIGLVIDEAGKAGNNPVTVELVDDIIRKFAFSHVNMN